MVRSAQVTLEVPRAEFTEAVSRTRSVADKFKGYVADSSITVQGRKATSGTLTIRVPSDRFREAIEAVRQLGHVKQEQESGRDLTDRFVDSEARLRHAKAEEVTYLKLLAEAKNVGEVVQVQEKISGVQLEIEQVQGQLTQVNDSVAFASLTIHIFQPGGTATTQLDFGTFGGAVRTSFEVARIVISSLIVLVGAFIPLVVVAVPLFILIRMPRRRRLRRRTT
ncbi:MAG: DUF4349 domain-containing protein [Actinomycetota bacterium]